MSTGRGLHSGKHQVRIGHWLFCKLASECICIDCHRDLPKGTMAWCPTNGRGTGTGRRLCVACMDHRRLGRRETAA